MLEIGDDTSDTVDQPEPNRTEAETQVSNVDWSKLVEKIREDDPSGMEELYSMFSRGIRLYLCRQLGLQELTLARFGRVAARDAISDLLRHAAQRIRRVRELHAQLIQRLDEQGQTSATIDEPDSGRWLRLKLWLQSLLVDERDL